MRLCLVVRNYHSVDTSAVTTIDFLACRRGRSPDPSFVRATAGQFCRIGSGLSLDFENLSRLVDQAYFLKIFLFTLVDLAFSLAKKWSKPTSPNVSDRSSSLDPTLAVMNMITKMSLHDSPGEPSTYDNCNHSHNLSVSKTPYLHEDATETPLRSFRFPVNHPVPDPVLLYPTESQEGNFQHSTESQISPGYESDAESIAMPSPTVLLTRKHSTDTSRPVADGRSDNTKWKGREEPSTLPRRRQSPDGPSLLSRPRKVGIAILAGMSISEEEDRGRSSDLVREPATSPQLHPYVSNSKHKFGRKRLFPPLR